MSLACTLHMFPLTGQSFVIIVLHSNWCYCSDLLNPKRVQPSFTPCWKPATVHIKDLPFCFKNAYIPFPVPPQTQNCAVKQLLRWIAKSDGVYCLIPSFCETPCTRMIQRPQIVVSGSCDGPRLLASANIRYD